MLSVSSLIRFGHSVDQRGPDECWLWTGKIAWNGYGKFNAGGVRFTASRLALELYLGRALDPEELACHRCDNRACVNPLHLFVGSERDNRADCVAKGRAHIPALSGASNGRAKLSESDVAEIRSLKGTALQRDIAGRFGVSRQTISAIHNGDRWNVSGAVGEAETPKGTA